MMNMGRRVLFCLIYHDVIIWTLSTSLGLCVGHQLLASNAVKGVEIWNLNFKSCYFIISNSYCDPYSSAYKSINRLFRLPKRQPTNTCITGPLWGGSHRWPTGSPHKRLLIRTTFPCHDIITSLLTLRFIGAVLFWAALLRPCSMTTSSRRIPPWRRRGIICWPVTIIHRIMILTKSARLLSSRMNRASDVKYHKLLLTFMCNRPWTSQLRQVS